MLTSPYERPGYDSDEANRLLGEFESSFVAPSLSPYSLRSDVRSPTPDESSVSPAAQAEAPTGSDLDEDAAALADVEGFSSPSMEATRRIISRALTMPIARVTDETAPRDGPSDAHGRGTRSRKGSASSKGSGPTSTGSETLKATTTSSRSKSSTSAATTSAAATKAASAKTAAGAGAATATTAADKQRDAKGKRPASGRQASLQSVTSSVETSSAKSGETASDITLGADYALQSGGAAPAPRSDTKTDSSLSRCVSLGSIASGVTGLDHVTPGWDKVGAPDGPSASTDLAPGHHHDEAGRAQADGKGDTSRTDRAGQQPRRSSNAAQSASSSSSGHSADMGGLKMKEPKDSELAQNVRDIHVPAAVRREFQRNNPPPAPPVRGNGTGGRGKGLTLKEHISTVDRLQKENFDLKLKVYHQSEALYSRSKEGMETVIAQNVDLKVALTAVYKQNRELRQQVSDLEAELAAKGKQATQAQSDQGQGSSKARSASTSSLPSVTKYTDQEVTYLRERVAKYEKEIAELKGAARSKPADNKPTTTTTATTDSRKASGDKSKGPTPAPAPAPGPNQHRRSVSDSSQDASQPSSQPPHAVDGTRPADRRSFRSGTSSTLVEQLRHENQELKREIGAQASMLTSRNREREKLHQEIEELRLGTWRGGDRTQSVAGDSVFDPSAPRARPRSGSKTSAETPVTVLTDVERTLYEHQLGQLRGEMSGLKLDNQHLTKKLDECLDDLEQAEANRAAREKELEAELSHAAHELRTLHHDRDEATAARQALEAAFEQLKREAEDEVGQLEAELEQRRGELRILKRDLSNRHENFHALQAEMRSLSEVVIRLEDDQRTRSREVELLQAELHEAHVELAGMERNLRDANAKIERYTVQQQSNQSEIAFLREEQETDKLKIGDLELAVKQARDSVKALETKIADERQEHERLSTKAKEDAQKVVDDLNAQLSSADAEVQRLRKLVTSAETDAKDWKDRFHEFEGGLREALGDQDASGSTLLRMVVKLQEQVEATSVELESAKGNLADRERILRHRDGLLESAGLESRKLSEMLERERQARKTDRHHYDQLEKSTRQALRSATQQEGRVLELESARQADRRRMTALEAQYKDQLLERNNLLLALWNRLSTMCGTEWSHKHSQVGGKLPSIEVIAAQLPGFSKNLLLAVKTVEGLVGGLKIRIRNVERDLWKEYQALEHNIDVRLKRLDRVESYVYGEGVTPGTKTENTKLRRENQMLRTELSALQAQDMPPRPTRHMQRSTSGQLPATGPDGAHAAAVTSFARHHSTTGVGMFDPAEADRAHGSVANDASEQRWIHRLRELEKRLKAEREARLQDRNGARKRLEEGRAEYEELKQELERERVRKGN